MENGQALVTTTPPLPELPAELDVFRVGELLAKSGYFADIKDMSQAVAKILAGREMGFGAIASLTGVYIQNGRPCYSANMIAAAVKKSRRYDYRVKKLDAHICELEFFEGGKSVGVSSFSVQDATTAGLTTGKNAHSWKNYPRNMLFARALTNGARFYCPDTFGGIPIYTPEELNVVVDGETGEVLHEPAPPKPDRPLTLAPKPQAAPQVPAQADARLISEAQQKRLFPMLREASVKKEDFKAYLLEQYKHEHMADIKREEYDQLCRDITEGGVTAWIVMQQEPATETEPGSEG